MKCGKPLTDERQEYCDDCRKKAHSFTQGRSLLSYQGAVKKSLYRFKYANRREYAESYGDEIVRYLGGWIRQKQITKIVPVPLHPSRRRKRGYNQSALLAAYIGREMRIPVDEKLIYRVKKTVPQKALSVRERMENLSGAFVVQKAIRRGEHILLVDDIYTTGSTADSIAICLKKTEKCQIYVLTVAIGG